MVIGPAGQLAVCRAKARSWIIIIIIILTQVLNSHGMKKYAVQYKKVQKSIIIMLVNTRLWWYKLGPSSSGPELCDAAAASVAPVARNYRRLQCYYRCRCRHDSCCWCWAVSTQDTTVVSALSCRHLTS